VNRWCWTVVLSLLAAVGLACQGDAGAVAFCVIHADNPHNSTTATRKGAQQIIGKGWFECERSVADLTMTVYLQRKSTIGWIEFGLPGVESFPNPPPNRKSKKVPAVYNGCQPGAYRTAARGTSTDHQGLTTTSDWEYSAEVTVLCP
jgi:hypothetical protein